MKIIQMLEAASAVAILAGCAMTDSQPPTCFIDGNLPACMDKIQALQAQGKLTTMTLKTDYWFNSYVTMDEHLVTIQDAPVDLLKYDTEISKLLPELAMMIKTNNWAGAPAWKAKFIPLWQAGDQLRQAADNLYISQHPDVQPRYSDPDNPGGGAGPQPGVNCVPIQGNGWAGCAPM